MKTETFPALASIGTIAHGFTLRAGGIDVKVARALALERLDCAHAAARAELGLGERRFIFAEQVHGANVAMVDAQTSTPVPAADGLLTTDAGICLGIYVADCGPVFLVDTRRRVIALLHSGRKGTELGIVSIAVERMVRELGCNPREIIAQLGPCIRAPHYEVDFATAILEQARAAGLEQVHDSRTCTAMHLDRYYSYRAEQGKTGRMLALLALR